MKYLKISFDYILAFILLFIFLPIIGVLAFIIFLDDFCFPFFIQYRIGKNAKRFKIIKLRTMTLNSNQDTVTTSSDRRITKMGRFLRKYKLDELPQLFNILKGDMSFVGPRPDVSGFADKLVGEDRIILSVLPGITGPAQIYYKDEEFLLSLQDDHERYNREVIWPNKVKLNKNYIRQWSLKNDFYYIVKTVIS